MSNKRRALWGEKKALSLLAVIILVFLLNPVPGIASFSESYFLDRSNIGLPIQNYVEVTIDGNDILQEVKFTVNPLTQGSPEFGPFDPNGPNYGIVRFGFNSPLSLSVSSFLRPPGWEVATDAQMDGFGRYDYVVERKAGGSSQDPLVFRISGLGIVDIIPGNFNQPKDPSASRFSAHVIDFDVEGTTSNSAYFGDPVSSSNDPPVAVIPELPAGFVGFFGLLMGGLILQLRRTTI